MARIVRFHAHVASDLQDAIAWYESISFELANRFRNNVKRCLANIEQRPESFGLADDSIRIARIDAFPYLVPFESSAKAIEILAVVHATTDPRKWKRRRS
jgi:plasmid stabilization system protein ParE